MFASPAIAGLNHLLADAPWARARLAPFAGRTAVFHVTPSVLSLGIDGSLSWITDAVKRLTDAGFVVVVSAGNAQKPACQQSPASAPAQGASR